MGKKDRFKPTPGRKPRKAKTRSVEAWWCLQGYNCALILAAFPHWADDGKPWEIWLDKDKNLGLRSAWVNQADIRGGLPREKWRAKDMDNEDRADWFNPREGKWIPVGAIGTLTADRWGRIAVPRQPTLEDWGLKLVLDGS